MEAPQISAQTASPGSILIFPYSWCVRGSGGIRHGLAGATRDFNIYIYIKDCTWAGTVGAPVKLCTLLYCVLSAAKVV